jgi:pimeloyl-ACP methyl ester carboxylesterase
MSNSFQFKPVDGRIIQHSVEKRGFVSVPLDYANPNGEQINIFYRLIPAYGTSNNDASKPIIVVINGGPGIPSSVYRSLDFDYANPESPNNGPFDRFKFILQTHRVLIADQRGTDGASAPLDITAFNLDGHAVAKYFSSDFQARDYLAVIEKVIPKNEKFLIISQSYGGMVGMQYLSLENARIPQALLFTCSALPYDDVMGAMMARRQEQLHLNHQLKKAYPDIDQKLNRVRDRLEKFGLDRNHVNGLYNYLGKSEAGIWEKVFQNRLDELLVLDKTGLEKEFKESVGLGNVLNYILSSANFTPGHTDRSLAEITSVKIPFEPWMVDENWTLLQIGKGNVTTERVIAEMDKTPPAPTPFLTPEGLRNAISRHQLIFVSADNDAYVPAESFKRSYEKFKVSGHTQEAHLPGGHHAIFLEEGHRSILKLQGFDSGNCV